MPFPTGFSSTTMVAPPDATAPVASVLDYLDQALQEHDAEITDRGEGFFEFKVPIGARLLHDMALRWRLGSTSWPLSFVGSGSFSATQLRDRVLITADHKPVSAYPRYLLRCGKRSYQRLRWCNSCPRIRCGCRVGDGRGLLRTREMGIRLLVPAPRPAAPWGT